jgi:hypothetical protein
LDGGLGRSAEASGAQDFFAAIVARRLRLGATAWAAALSHGFRPFLPLILADSLSRIPEILFRLPGIFFVRKALPLHTIGVDALNHLIVEDILHNELSIRQFFERGSAARLGYSKISGLQN